jgi:hypothetical protein
LLLSGVGFCVEAGLDTARAAGSGHGSTLSARNGLGWDGEGGLPVSPAFVLGTGGVVPKLR